MFSKESPSHNPSDDLEANAAAQLECEQKEEFPKSAEQLIEATKNTVDSLASRLAQNPIAFEYLIEISARVQRYLSDSETGEASRYAKVLVTNRDDSISLAAIGNQFVSEINPLLFGLQRAIVENNGITQAGASAEDILEKEGGLIGTLKTGLAGSQKTTSFFGLVEGLSITQEVAPRNIVLIDPFSVDEVNKKYWQERMNVREEVTGQKQTSYEELISFRSTNAVFELDIAAEEAEAKGDLETAEALVILAQYIEDKIDLLTHNFRKTVHHLSFLDGQADDVFDILNAAEVVKHKKPELYARLLGVTQSRDSSEAGRSDLFGNIFQIALYRSAHSRVTGKGAKIIVGRQVLAERVKGLTEMNTDQLPLQHINAEQMETLQAKLKKELKKPSKKQNEFLIVELISALIPHTNEMNLHELLEAVSEKGEEALATQEKLEARRAKREELKKMLKEMDLKIKGKDRIELSPLIISNQLALGMITKGKARRSFNQARKDGVKILVDCPKFLTNLAEAEVKNGFDSEETLELVKKQLNTIGYRDYVESFDDLLKIVDLEFTAGKDPSEILEKIKKEFTPDSNSKQAVEFYCDLALLEFKMGKDPTESLEKAKAFFANQGFNREILNAFFEIAATEIKIGQDASETVDKIIEHSLFDFGDNDDGDVEKFLNLISVQLEFGHDPFELIAATKKKVRTVKDIYKIAGFEAKNKLDFSETLKLAQMRGKDEPDAEKYKAIYFDSEVAGEDRDQLLQVIEKLKKYLPKIEDDGYSELIRRLVILEKKAGIRLSQEIFNRVGILEVLIENSQIEDLPKLADFENSRFSESLLKRIGQEADVLLEEERHVDVREVRELFGEHFFGPEQVEKAFIITDQEGKEIKLVDFSPEEREHIEQMLTEKLNEPDIQKFLQKPENREAIKKGEWLLMLRVDKIKTGGEDVPLTMEKMRELLEPDMVGKEQGKLFLSQAWFNGENFYQKNTPRLQWTLVTKKVVSSTLGLDHKPMTEALSVEANRVGFDSTKIKRRTPAETFFDFFTVLRTMATDNRILLDAYDWSNIRSSDGNLVYVGDGDSGGLNVDGGSLGSPHGSLGASLSR